MNESLAKEVLKVLQNYPEDTRYFLRTEETKSIDDDDIYIPVLIVWNQEKGLWDRYYRSVPWGDTFQYDGTE